MRISKTIAITTAAALVSVATFFPKSVMAEKAMLTLKAIPDSAAIANFEKECPNLAKWLKGPARERAIEIAANTAGIKYAPEARKPPEAERNDAEAASALSDLNGQINRYSDLTASERAGLEKKVNENGDAGLISRLNSAKEASGEPAPSKQSASPVAGAGTGETEVAEVHAVVQPTVAGIPAKAAGADIGALYGQVNLYSELSAPERAELEKKVMESDNSGLINYFNQAKENAAPAAKEAEPAKADSAPAQAVEPEQLPAKKVEIARAPHVKAKAAPVPKPAVTEPKVAAVGKATETMAKDATALKDSLQSAITACYGRINMMGNETFAADSAEIAGAIGKMEAVVGKAFPSGNEWAEYKMRHLKEYFAGACSAISGRNE